MALKIVLPALLLLLLLVCCASEAQGQGAGVSLPLVFNGRAIITDYEDQCPDDEILEVIKERVSTDIQSDLQEKIFPSILLSEGWTRVAYLNMTNTSHQCPSGWQTYTTPTRACGRNSNYYSSCRSVFYPTNGVSYNRVCGRVIAYQYCATDAFDPYNNNPTRTINDVYVDGISITHGSPRQHVWTFAAAYSASYIGTSDWACPCTNVNNNDNPNILIPPFVGDDYYCDTGTVTSPSSCSISYSFYDDDPLWDGAGCSSTSTCCELNNPPWFCKTLPDAFPVTDDIEVRICGDSGSVYEDTPVELIELYVF